MSEPFFNDRRNQLQFINCAIGIHDLVCSCSSPLKHSSVILTKEYLKQATEEEKKDLQTCLGITTTGGDHGDAAGDIDFTGDLEQLFAQDFDDANG